MAALTTHGSGMHEPPLPESLWSVDELAEYLGTTKRYVYRLTSEKRIKFYRYGKTVHFDPVDVATFLAGTAEEPEAPPRKVSRRPGRPRKQ